MPNCFELGNCDFGDHFFDWALAPFTVGAGLGDFVFPLVWGLVVGLIYVKSEHSGLTSIVGLFILTGLVSTNSYLNSSSNQLYFWAVAIAATAFGCSLYYLFKIRVHNP